MYNFVSFLTTWHNSFFDLRTIEAKNLKKLRTASLNSKFTGSCTKSVIL